MGTCFEAIYPPLTPFILGHLQGLLAPLKKKKNAHFGDTKPLDVFNFHQVLLFGEEIYGQIVLFFFWYPLGCPPSQ